MTPKCSQESQDVDESEWRPYCPASSLCRQLPRRELHEPGPRVISGGSHEGTHDDDLRQRVRRALTSGMLFLVDRKSRARSGSGKLCAVCTSAIAEGDIEYEVPGGVNGTLVAHLACYLVWRKESEAARLRSDPSEGGM